MIKEFLLTLVGVVFLSTACEMLIPNGSVKKYYQLAIGFVVMCVMVKPLTNIIQFSDFEFTFDSEMSEAQMQAESNAYILKLHEENIRKRIIEICGRDTDVFVELFTDGRVKSIRMRGEGIGADKILKIKEEMGTDNVEIVSGENYEY